MNFLIPDSKPDAASDSVAILNSSMNYTLNILQGVYVNVNMLGVNY